MSRFGVLIEEIRYSHLDDIVGRPIHRRRKEGREGRNGHLGYLAIISQRVEESVLELR